MSVWAIWSALCDVNATTARSARTLLGDPGIHRCVFNARADAPWLLEAHTLGDAQRRLACATTWAFDADAVERRWLRYCPACMAASYHAACFQHRALSRCPVHNLPLIERCGQCGGRIPVTYEAARAAPFGCRSCARRLARASAKTLSAAQTAAIAATTSALTRSGATVSRIGKSGVGRVLSSLEAGHASWWCGVDPFVEGSAWQPHRAWVSTADGDDLDAQAWTALVRFVEGRLSDPALIERIHAVAEGIERRDRCMPPVTLAISDWAAAALIARYGEGDFRRARRLLRNGCSPSLFPFTPQASCVVVLSGEANAIVVKAEARIEYVRLAKWIARRGPESLFDTVLSAQGLRVNWCLTRSEGDFGELQWRAFSEGRLQCGCCSRRLRVQAAQCDLRASRP